MARLPAPTASISAGHSSRAHAPDVASFSSRGPALAAGGDLLKPDIMAPGRTCLRGSPPSSATTLDFLSGTSMSSPHLAGLPRC